MTQSVSDIIEQTIRLQQQTNRTQMLCFAMILISDVLIILSVLNIRKATRVNQRWSDANAEWSKRLGESDRP